MALDQWFAQWFAVTWPNITHIFTFFSCIFLSGLIQEGISLPTSDGCCSLRTSKCSIVEKVRREGTWKRFCGRLHGKQVSNLGQFGSQIYCRFVWSLFGYFIVSLWVCYAGDESFIPFFATASGNAVATLNQPTHARIEHTVIAPRSGQYQCSTSRSLMKGHSKAKVVASWLASVNSTDTNRVLATVQSQF